MSDQVENAVAYFKNIILDKLEGVKCWVAGGALRDYFAVGYPKSDIDVFFPSEEQYNLADAKLAIDGYKCILDNESGKMYKIKKRLIHIVKSHFFDSPQHTIDSFDFTVCCAAVDNDAIFHHESFFMDLARRRLVINALPFPLSTLQRLQKYIKKGYWICNGGILKISKGIKEVDFDNKKENGLEFYPDGTPKFLRID